MIKSKPCTVEDCNNPRFSKGFCKYHQHLRTDDKYLRSQEISSQNINKFGTKNKPKTASKIVKNWRGKRKTTGEGAMFEVIWSTRPHKSFISGVGLGNEAKASFFAHVLGKGKYPRYRLNLNNVVLLSEEEHQLFDAGTEDQREAYRERMFKERGIYVDWEKLYQLREELKQEYNDTNA